MKIRSFMLSDFEEVVAMYHDLTKEIYPDRQIGEKYFFYKSVLHWVESGKDIVVCENSDVIVGFTMAYLDVCGGITEHVYNGELAYVKPKYRKSRAAYLLYNNVSDYAKEQGITLVANAYVGGNDKVDQIQKKLGGKQKFISMERPKW